MFIAWIMRHIMVMTISIKNVITLSSKKNWYVGFPILKGLILPACLENDGQWLKKKQLFSVEVFLLLLQQWPYLNLTGNQTDCCHLLIKQGEEGVAPWQQKSVGSLSPSSVNLCLPVSTWIIKKCQGNHDHHFFKVSFYAKKVLYLIVI